MTYAYDANANRVRMQDALGRTTYTYDELDRPRRVTNAYGKSITYVWDALSQRRSLTDPDGGRFTYVYDTVNRFQSVTNPQNERTTCTYDAANRRLEQQNANGTKATYLYDVADQTTRVANRKGDGSMISNLDYRYEPAGNRVDVTEANGDRVTWTYDNTYQLTREQRSGAHAYDTTYVYDPAGNRLQKLDSGTRTTSAYDAADQLIYAHDATGRTTFTFDAAGNQQIELAPDGGRTTNVWDYDNMRTGVTLASGIRNTFAYNGDLQRLEKQDTAGTARFTWDQQNILLETDETNAIQAVYTLEPRQYGSLVSQYRLTSGIWTPSQNHQDVLGSILQLTSAGQAVTDEYLYQAFGRIVAASGSTSNQFRWIGSLGYFQDDEDETFYIRRRVYRAAFTRWISIDPPHFNVPYRYAFNSPLLFIDPSGMVEYEVRTKGTSTKPIDCRLVVTLRFCAFFFNNNNEKPYWTKKIKQIWRENAKSAIAKGWSAKCKFQSATPCKDCPEGVRVIVKPIIDIECGPTTPRDKTFLVYEKPLDREYVNRDRTHAYLDRDSYVDVKHEIPERWRKPHDPEISWHSPISHEVGHLLGLEHPGREMGIPFDPNDPLAEYLVDYKSIMGAGKAVRKNHCSKIFGSAVNKEFKDHCPEKLKACDI